MEEALEMTDQAQREAAERRFGADRNLPLSVLKNVEMQVAVELGRAKMTVGALLALAAGDVIELDRSANAAVDVLVNGTLVAKGEVVVVDDEFGVRITEVVAREDMVTSAQEGQ
ncbi:flagellar motor switch protein FliN [Ferrithrix thermotolerans DSM 19514]|uniref:Flagellar motor switch protein FliN n=1 Tax=Ferrithrix thermotolerans DSM 19514 TaxID=1121881 RepID=A0A1M4W996_9ACTN|nr:flagellar motor switch protein FliN [Ferrithrix thermotolerans]SHE77730.1 flagellar motor switch protein FliN [Ferrithrix thermotolerans DSM 19514]